MKRVGSSSSGLMVPAASQAVLAAGQMPLAASPVLAASLLQPPQGPLTTTAAAALGSSSRATQSPWQVTAFTALRTPTTRTCRPKATSCGHSPCSSVVLQAVLASALGYTPATASYPPRHTRDSTATTWLMPQQERVLLITATSCSSTSTTHSSSSSVVCRRSQHMS